MLLFLLWSRLLDVFALDECAEHAELAADLGRLAAADVAALQHPLQAVVLLLEVLDALQKHRVDPVPQISDSVGGASCTSELQQ